MKLIDRLYLKLRRSAGVPVTLAVHRLIARGNRARDAGDWRAAADAYAAATTRDPALGHIWVQLGHAAKEAGDPARAGLAYARAVALRPDDGEAMGQLVAMAGHVEGAARAALAEAAASRLPPDPLGDWAAGPPPATDARIVFDVSDLLSYFTRARLPTGIQRVQIEVIRAALEAGEPIRLAGYVEGREDWLEVHPERFRRLVTMALASGDREAADWRAANHRLQLDLALGEPIGFPPGATLVTLGTSWWLRNYFLMVRHAKATAGIRYVPLVYDMIPVLAPEHCIEALVRDFVAWTLGVFAHADAFFAISEATKRDLLAVAARLGIDLSPGQVTVFPLDADFRHPDLAVLGDEALAPLGLAGEPFVLFVSTIESRKGHLVAFDAWKRLIEEHGAAAVPRLVCVGNKGWLNDAVYDRLAADKVLSGRVSMLSGLSDATLALLYRRARFTVYPSLYEGWGLPVTEALCWGRPVIASDSSSLPEAGGRFAVHVPAGDAAALADAVWRMHGDDAWRAEWERLIAAEFRPGSWRAIAAGMAVAAVRLAAEPARPATPPVAEPGHWHDLSRDDAMAIWPHAASAEAFRAGTGWQAPEKHGCRLRAGGGRLAIGLSGDGPWRLSIRLLNTGEAPVDWRVGEAAGTVPPNGEKWAVLTRDGGETWNVPLAGDTLDLLVAGFTLDPVETPARQDWQDCPRYRDPPSSPRP